MLPGVSGIEVAERVRDLAPSVAVLIWTGHAAARPPDSLHHLIRGYVPKLAAIDDLVAAIPAVAQGRTFVLTAESPGRVQGDAAPMLSEREREVLRLVASGLPDSEIAAELRVSLRSVESYISSAKAKVGARSRTDVVLKAYARGLLTLNLSNLGAI
jgi:two-component system response regulator DesR